MSKSGIEGLERIKARQPAVIRRARELRVILGDSYFERTLVRSPDARSNFVIMQDSTTNEYVASDSTTIPVVLPVGPKVKLEVKEYDFDRLVRELVEYEQEFGLSSLEIFSQYVHGDLDEKMEEWLDLFILYLGTGEVRQFSCP